MVNLWKQMKGVRDQNYGLPLCAKAEYRIREQRVSYVSIDRT